MLEPVVVLNAHQTTLTKIFNDLDKAVDRLVQSAKLAA
jgi:hypothetical protein